MGASDLGAEGVTTARGTEDEHHAAMLPHFGFASAPLGAAVTVAGVDEPEAGVRGASEAGTGECRRSNRGFPLSPTEDSGAR